MLRSSPVFAQLDRSRRWLARAFALALAVACSLPALGADSAKTLRVAMSIAETSFDPAFASDAVSDGIIANVFDT
ncbi:MAG TPA: hypothetical protein VFJ25_01200, partial [Casimicrobiaceae bacterium]|nr:hypothetical protein [Casimicrobiaceae bacterium]